MKKAQQESASRIRWAAQLIEELAPLEIRRCSQQRKHRLERAYGTLSLHTAKLQLRVPTLSTLYYPQEYLEAARDVLDQLARLEAITQPGHFANEGRAPGQDAGWRVQPEESPEINYRAFQLCYGFSRQEIDWLVTLMRRYRPGVPILNRSVEWGVLRQRDMEAQNALAGRPGADPGAGVPWHPHEVPWWEELEVILRRTIIAVYFGEWMHAAYPLLGGDDHGRRLVAQLEAVLSSAVEQLTDLLDTTKKGGAVPESELLLALAHILGSFISLTHLSAGRPDGLELVWLRLLELSEPVDALIARLAVYYERLAGREPPMQGDTALLIDVFHRGR